jgi:hypothetical protein
LLLMAFALVVTALVVSAQLPTTPPPAAARQHDPVFDSAAVVAWRQFERLWIPSTGLAKATFDYDKLTSWDMGSVLGALYSAHVLGFLDAVEYHGRMCRTLETLEQLPLFQDGMFHKLYDARTGKMVGRGGVPTSRGHAWSATDLGRLLVWLRIIARSDPIHAEIATRVVRRLKFNRVVENGYLYGEDVSPRGRTYRFQEGRIGYEQYAARGFALWGQDVALALDINTHSAPLKVLGVDLLKDTRGLDRLTSEPFVLLGLEVGWTADEAALARNVLEVQAQRFRNTRLVTIASEDAVGIAPHFFYYYCVYCTGRAFVIELSTPGRRLNSPRWISTKATFGWHALLPSAYTRLALETIAPARASVGWSSGVMERSHTPTRSYDLNTAAVILEAAAFHKLGRPLLPAETLSAPAR